MHSELRQPVAREALPEPQQTAPPGAAPWDPPVPQQFAEIGEAAYEALAGAWRSDGRGCEPPLNPEQREAARCFLRVVLQRVRGLRNGESAAEIGARMRALDESIVLQVAGPGGTGKSAMLRQLRAYLREEYGVHLLITAYTGVAACPFGSPTLLSLLNLGIRAKGATHCPPSRSPTSSSKASRCSASSSRSGTDPTRRT